MIIIKGTKLRFLYIGSVFDYVVKSDYLENPYDPTNNNKLFDAIGVVPIDFCSKFYDALPSLQGWPKNTVANDFRWIPKMFNALADMGVKCYVMNKTGIYENFHKRVFPNLKEGDKVCLNGYRHVVETTFLNNKEGINDQIFRDLGYDEEAIYHMAAMCYGYDVDNGTWPSYNEGDYAALDRLLRHLMDCCKVNVIVMPKEKVSETNPSEGKPSADKEEMYFIGGLLEQIEEKFTLTIEKEQRIELKFT